MADDDSTIYIDVAARLDERSADEVEHRLRDKLSHVGDSVKDSLSTAFDSLGDHVKVLGGTLHDALGDHLGGKGGGALGATASGPRRKSGHRRVLTI